MNIRLRSFDLVIRKHVLGYANVEIEDLGMVIHGVCLRTRDGAAYALPPGSLKLDADGQPRRHPDTGAPVYYPTVSFLDKEDFNAFSSAVVEAVMEASPEARKAATWRGGRFSDQEAP